MNIDIFWVIACWFFAHLIFDSGDGGDTFFWNVCSYEDLHRAVFQKMATFTVEVEVEVCPGVRCPSGTHDQFFFFLEMSFRQLRLCCFVAPSLARGRVCNLLVQLLLGLAIAVTLGSKSRRTHGHILLSHLRLPNLEGQVPVFISPRNRVARLYPRALCL
jgi:hypothetical protein